MSIIVANSGRNAVRVPAMPMPHEGYLEEYVALNPDAIPLDQIREGLTLLVLARQFPTLSGPVDVLAVDDAGTLYIIETKLYRNPDKRRVVAQMLDYGAAVARELGAAGDPVAALAGKLPKMDLRGRIQEEFGNEEQDRSADEILHGMGECLRNGTLRFIVLMDGLDDRLRDLIRFVNQFSRFAILAVEAKFYRYGELEIVIPTLFGAERVAASAVRGSEAALFGALARTLPPSQAEACRRLYKALLDLGADPNWGRGELGAFNPRVAGVAARSILMLNAQGRLYVNFKWMDDTARARVFRRALAEALGNCGLNVPQDYEQRFPSFPPAAWCPKVDDVIEAG